MSTGSNAKAWRALARADERKTVCGIEGGEPLDARIQAAVRYVEERLNETVPLEAAANYVSLSPFHFHRLFRQEVGEPFYAYVKRVRMSGAAARLKWTSDSLLEIATAFGYSSNAAFSHAFAGYFGCSPTAFRNDTSNWPQYATEHSVNPTIAVREIETFRCLAKRYHGDYSMVHMHWRDFLNCLPAQFPRHDRNSHFVGLVHDHPRITPAERLRYDCCCVFTNPPDPRITDPDPTFQLLQTRPGRYALLEHQGPPSSRAISYSRILDEWLPTTDYVMTDDPAIELFRSTPMGSLAGRSHVSDPRTVELTRPPQFRSAVTARHPPSIAARRIPTIVISISARKLTFALRSMD